MTEKVIVKSPSTEGGSHLPGLPCLPFSQALLPSLLLNLPLLRRPQPGAGEQCEDKRKSQHNFPCFSPKCLLTGAAGFPGCKFSSGRRWSWTEIRLKSGRMALFTKFLTYHRPRSTPGQLEFSVASFQRGLQKKRFCFSAIFLHRNQGEVGEEVPCSGFRAVEPSDLEVKADTKSDLLSSTSHFSELCLLGPFRGQSACRQRGVNLWF